jgi:hypothetical protein
VAVEAKRTFEESLMRVLDPEGVYWNYPGDDNDDPERVRLIEVRLDVPISGVMNTQKKMQCDGWTLHSQPDEASDPIQRLYYRKEQSLRTEHKIAMLTISLRAAHEVEGMFWSWANVEMLDEN